MFILAPAVKVAMSEKEFKKLLIDLDLSLTQVAAGVGLTVTAVRRYFKGELRNRERRKQIRVFLVSHAGHKGLSLPEFWPDSEV